MSIITELKRRKVFRVAVVYAVVAWGLLQVVDVISEPLGVPGWFTTVAILLLGIGFPIALILAWAFDIGPDGLTRTSREPAAPLDSRGIIEVGLLVVLVIGIGWLIFRDVDTHREPAYGQDGTPIVIMMDTFAPYGVYDEETRRKSGTNADVLSDVLADLPIVTQKETVGSTWDREVQVLKQNPSLILIHLSAFFHSMNQDFDVGYPLGSEPPSEEFVRVYNVAENKLVAFMGYIAQGNPGTKFVVYSRGTGGGWAEDEYRVNWIKQVQGRFPALAGRVTAMSVPGGVTAGSFSSPDGASMIRALVQQLLHLNRVTADAS